MATNDSSEWRDREANSQCYLLLEHYLPFHLWRHLFKHTCQYTFGTLVIFACWRPCTSREEIQNLLSQQWKPLSLDILKIYGVSEVMKFVRMTADWPMADRFKAPSGHRSKSELITLGCHRLVLTFILDIELHLFFIVAYPNARASKLQKYESHCCQRY